MAWWIKDPRTRKLSVSLTFFAIGFWIALGKLLLSNMTLWGITFEGFDGMQFAAVVAALGSVYTIRRHLDPDKGNQVQPEQEK